MWGRRALEDNRLTALAGWSPGGPRGGGVLCPADFALLWLALLWLLWLWFSLFPRSLAEQVPRVVSVQRKNTPHRQTWGLCAAFHTLVLWCEPTLCRGLAGNPVTFTL